MLKECLIAVTLILAFPAGVFAAEFEAIDLGKPKTAQKKEEAAPQPAANAKQTASECQDDPRLETEIVEIMETDDPVVVPPLTVTPETYISMEPEVLAKLGGQLVICPKNPLLKSGKTLRKVEIAFPVLWDQIQKAVTKGDEDKLKMLFANFSSKPMGAADIVNFLTPINFGEEKTKFLYQTAGLNPNANARDKSVLDFFNLTGGRTNDKTFIVITNMFPSEIDEWKRAHKEDSPFILIPDNNLKLDPSYAQNALRATGLTVENKRR